MAPNIRTRADNAEEQLNGVGDLKANLTRLDDEVQKPPVEYKMSIVWRNVILIGYLHLAALYGFYLCFTSAKWQTSLSGN